MRRRRISAIPRGTNLDSVARSGTDFCRVIHYSDHRFVNFSVSIDIARICVLEMHSC